MDYQSNYNQGTFEMINPNHDDPYRHYKVGPLAVYEPNTFISPLERQKMEQKATMS